MNYINKYFNLLPPLYSTFDKLINTLEIGHNINVLASRQVGISTLLARIYTYHLFNGGKTLYLCNLSTVDIKQGIRDMSEELSINVNKIYVDGASLNIIDRYRGSDFKLIIIENQKTLNNIFTLEVLNKLREMFKNAQFLIVNVNDSDKFENIREENFDFVNFKITTNLEEMSGIKVYNLIKALGLKEFEDAFVVK